MDFHYFNIDTFSGTVVDFEKVSSMIIVHCKSVSRCKYSIEIRIASKTANTIGVSNNEKVVYFS